MPGEPTLDELRQQIDRLDDQLLVLFAERVRLALLAGELKHREGRAIYDPERERAILERLCQSAPDPLEPAMVRRIFERLIDESRHAEQRRRG